jgi:hypothetical protein
MGEISKEDSEQLRELEESLWQQEYRFNRSYMEATLAPDFFEFGRSGRVYERDDTLTIEMQPTHARLPLLATDGALQRFTRRARMGLCRPVHHNRSD